jgi:hypothetical protein
MLRIFDMPVHVPMFSPIRTLYDFIVHGSREELQTHLEALKTRIGGYRLSHNRIAEDNFMGLVQEQITYRFADQTPAQVQTFYHKMFERCFELGYRLDPQQSAYFVDESGRPIASDYCDTFLVDITMAVPGTARHYNLMPVVMRELEAIAQRSRGSAPSAS